MIQIGTKPDSGFDDPIGMLKDCHRRIERFLEILFVVVDRAHDRALTTEEAAAVESALAYFRTGGQRHNQDEEESLFPRLRQYASGDTMTRIEALEIDHRSGDELHNLVEQKYRSWIALGSLSSADQQQLRAATEHLKSLYQAHIAVEEEVVFPGAAKLLDSAEIRSMGEEFRLRRA
ncbi:MAG TPA: hemerythrin domain-containing protein [Terracidiphilus sp.]|jgi:hemerythrin-like domain-containing protein